MIATRQMFRPPAAGKGTAGGVFCSTMPASPPSLTLNHTMRPTIRSNYSRPSSRRWEYTASRKLSEIAKTIRSKNAGVDKITFDVIFPTAPRFGCARAVSCRALPSAGFRRRSGPDLRPPSSTRLGDQVYDIPPDAERQPCDANVFGSQQYGPLLDIEVLACREIARALPDRRCADSARAVTRTADTDYDESGGTDPGGRVTGRAPSSMRQPLYWLLTMMVSPFSWGCQQVAARK